MSHIRLFLGSEAFRVGQLIEVPENDFWYLTRVMRKKQGSKLLVFNGSNGEWLAEITLITKKSCTVKLITNARPQYYPPKLTLAFALLKNTRPDFVASKATELGVTTFQPLITQNSVVNTLNFERFKANIKEASEQCGRTDLPVVKEITKLSSFLEDLKDKNFLLILADESGRGKSAKLSLSGIARGDTQEIVVFIGPEGGFSAAEFEKFYSLPGLHSINLGPRILRAETAIISILTLTQEFLGDFNS